MIDLKEKGILTVPNLLTVIRIILIVPFIISFINENYVLTFIIVVLSVATDMFDGIIARRFNQVSDLGKILDPIADKLSLFAIAICYAIKIPVVLPLAFVMVAKEVIMLLGGLFLMKKGLQVPSAKWFGKLATIVFYLSVVVLTAIYIVNHSIDNNTAIIFMVVNVIFMLYALIRYAIMFVDNLKNNK